MAEATVLRQAWRVYQTERGPVRLQCLAPKAGSKIRNAIQTGLDRGYRYCHPMVRQHLERDRSAKAGYLVMPTGEEAASIFMVLQGGMIVPVRRNLDAVERSNLGWLLVMADPVTETTQP